MKTIKGLSALMLASAFIFSTAAFAAPAKKVVKQQAKTETKAVVKTDAKASKPAAKETVKPVAKKKGPSKKAVKKPVSNTKPAAKGAVPASK